MSNVLAFTVRKSANTAGTTRPSGSSNVSGTVVSLDAYRAKSHARRTSSGVFFTTGVLTTTGTSA